MGIPHLITTLENYASHEILQHQVVVIDGPALAYHILHLCRFQGANQPSYGLLSRLVIEWLDRLEDQQVTMSASAQIQKVTSKDERQLTLQQSSHIL